VSATVSSRPLGVAILAVLMGIFGFLLLLAGILVLAGVTASIFLGTPTFFGAAGATAGLIFVIFGLIVLAVAYGLYDLRLWALALALLVLIVYLVLYALAGAFFSLGFLVSLFLTVYLLAVARHFS
jgi:hypothetical protein